MFKQSYLLKSGLLVSLFLLLVACGKEDAVESAQKQVNQTTSANINSMAKEKKVEVIKEADKTTIEIEELSWDKLIPADYNPNEIINKYTERLDQLQDSDQEAIIIYGKIQAELDNAPVNMSLDGKTIRIPGFVAPLENVNGIINEFLLVPYFGACIHTPPPPSNQTVMIKANKGQGVKSEDSYLPVWITGKLKTVVERTSIGTSGYKIENAIIEPYREE